MPDPLEARRWIAGTPRVYMADDGRPRLDRPPVIAAPPSLPPVWPGGEPRFPVDFYFYLTALRAELAHLIDRAKAYRRAWGSVEKPPARAAAAIYYHARGFRHYHAGMLREAEKPPRRIILASEGYRCPLEIVVERIVEAGGVTAVEFANAVSAPEFVGVLEWAYGFLPDVRFDFDVPRGPADVPAEPAAVDAPSKGDPEPPAVDFAALVSALRKAGKPVQAALVEYMADKREATVEDVAEHVHGHRETGDKAVARNARRATQSVAEMRIGLAFKVASGRVFLEISRR